jgi:membrane-bound lytic murein transglycosylase C
MHTGPAPHRTLHRRSLLFAGVALAAGCTSRGAVAPVALRTGDLPHGADADADAEAALREATRRLDDKCARLWGSDNVKLPTATSWVAYDDDWTSRGEIDFAGGVFTAQVLIDAGPDALPPDAIDTAMAKLRKRLEDAATDTAADFADDDDVAKLAAVLAGQTVPSAPQPAAPSGEAPVLAGVLPRDARARLTPDALTPTAVVGGDGRKRVMLSYRVPFEDDYFLTLAARYAGSVHRQAQRLGLTPSLVFAVIETESAFNPRARSAVPAYGLMQLVPRTAGRDAYAFIHGTARAPDAQTLYDPDTNITLGTAYLKILDSQYLRAINDAESRTYAAIAAYNTGAGNVAWAFDGTTRIAAAARLINTLPPDEVLRRLKADLPEEETRRYVAAVLARQDRYRRFDEGAPGQMLVAQH